MEAYSPSFLPVFQNAAVRSGAADVFVAPGETRTLAAGEYGAVTIAQTGSLVLAGGVYDVRSVSPVTTSGGACPFPCRSVRFAAPASVRIAERFDTGKSSSNTFTHVGGFTATVLADGYEVTIPLSVPSTISTRSSLLGLRQGFGFFSIQGRVDEALAGGGFRRGLRIRSTPPETWRSASSRSSTSS